jgi:predicted acyltransferase (DUF342 family)
MDLKYIKIIKKEMYKTKKDKKYNFFIISLILIIILSSTIIYSNEYKKENKSKFRYGSRIIIEENINNSLMILAQRIIIDSEIKGNLYAASSNIIINKPIYGDIFLASQYITINAPIYGNIRAYCQELTINKDSIIEGKLNSNAQEVIIRGEIKKDITIGATEVKIYGKIKNADIKAQEIYLDPNAEIKGNIYYDSENYIINTNIIEGKLISSKEKDSFLKKNLGIILGFLFSYISFLLVGLVLLKMPWMNIDSKINLLKNNFLKHILYGFLLFITIPLLLILLLISIVGIPLAILGAALYIGFLYTAKLYICVLLGKFLFKKHKRWKQFSLALFIYLLLANISYIGIIVSTISILSGFGVIFFSIKKTFHKY